LSVHRGAKAAGSWGCQHLRREVAVQSFVAEIAGSLETLVHELVREELSAQ
jgi:hypothetical protein